MNFEKTAQSTAERQALAAAAVAAYKTHRTANDYDPAYTEYFTRLCAVSYNTGTTIASDRILVFDILETGYMYYSVSIPTTAQNTGAEFTAQLGGEIEGATYRASNANVNLGELIYKTAN